MQRPLTAVIERERHGCVALWLELDIASQGDTVEEARMKLREALEPFFASASPEEVVERMQGRGCAPRFVGVNLT